ncbi:hypothetical protein NP233_g8361 [Leucocoprinus birnbaumii]|uniref:DUF6535 domain-containing protein n=1 Tax=Leucocoprinus birnbaumii TaxID=56174 RepID=A0AAD5VP51_9AGAR|nr:hypothetical protein NP233_g8361 [Leucocoprinus birnbaumii]
MNDPDLRVLGDPDLVSLSETRSPEPPATSHSRGQHEAQIITPRETPTEGTNYSPASAEQDRYREGDGHRVTFAEPDTPPSHSNSRPNRRAVGSSPYFHYGSFPGGPGDDSYNLRWRQTANTTHTGPSIMSPGVSPDMYAAFPGHLNTPRMPNYRFTPSESVGPNMARMKGVPYNGVPQQEARKYLHVTDNMSEEANPWQTCSDFTKQLVEEENASWKDEIEKLLIFAGLFSGIVTAFTLRSLSAVDDGDPSQAAVLLLKTIVGQLNHAADPNINSSIDLNPQIHVSLLAKRINTLWLSSLALSLSTAVLGILCLQWIREAGRSPYTSHHEHLAIHYMRQEGMQQWQVFRILKVLPALLIISLLLFFAGLIEVSLGVDGTLATFPTVIMGLTVAVVWFTTIAPGLQSLLLTVQFKQSQCPYKSPQSWIIHRAAMAIRGCIGFLATKLHLSRSHPFPFTKIHTWFDYDRLHLKHRQETGTSGTADVGKGLGWIANTFFQSQNLAKAVLHCLQDLPYPVVLDAFLGQLDERISKRVQSMKDVLIQNSRSIHDQQEGKTRYLQDLVTIHTLGFLGKKIEGRFVSSSLLNERIKLFLRINQHRSTANVDILCPIDRDNINRISRSSREEMLRCLNAMLDANMHCGESHFQGLFEILRSMILERISWGVFDTNVSETLDNVAFWIKRGVNTNERLKLGVSLRKLKYSCHGNQAGSDWAAVDDYCRELNDYIASLFSAELLPRNDFDWPLEPSLEYLYKYMAWQEIEGYSKKEDSVAETA